jgi:peptide methionine sulfoxide reductase msrA/msrB
MTEYKKAYFAGGCFWGVEHLFQKKAGVVEAVSGYMGGTVDNPTYQQVCAKTTGHLETVEVTYDPSQVSFEDLARYFFEIHDPTQVNGQGPDIGPQYLSAVFYSSDEEKKTAAKLIEILQDKGYQVATQLIPAETFWRAEDYHQDYYDKKNQQPYCHFYQKRF